MLKTVNWGCISSRLCSQKLQKLAPLFSCKSHNLTGQTDFPRELTAPELRRAVDAAASYDEKTGVDQVISLKMLRCKMI